MTQTNASPTAASPPEEPWLPARRFAHTLSSGEQGTFLVGGSNRNECLGDTFRWHNACWWETKRLPRPLASHAMASLRGAPVVFGGQNQAGVLVNETLEWTDAGWQSKPLAGSPRPRAEHAMATREDKIILFGGRSREGRLLWDTWEYDGSAWRELKPHHSPPPLYGHAMTTVGRDVVLFGGVLSQQSLDDLSADVWLFDGDDWRLFDAGGFFPEPRWGHSLTACGEGAVLFGGLDRQLRLRKNLRIWSPAGWEKWEETGGPCGRAHHAAALVDGAVMIMGGAGLPLEGCFGDTWQWSPHGWSLLDPGRTSALDLVYGNSSASTSNKDFRSLLGDAYTIEMWCWLPKYLEGSPVITEIGRLIVLELLVDEQNLTLKCFVPDGSDTGYRGRYHSLPRRQGRQWYHLAVTRAGGELPVVYLDGKPCAPVEQAGLTSPNTSPDLKLHGGGAAGHMCRVAVDELRLSTGIRYSQPFSPPPFGTRLERDVLTCALWHFDETGGTAAIDAVGTYRLVCEGGALINEADA